MTDYMILDCFNRKLTTSQQFLEIDTKEGFDVCKLMFEILFESDEFIQSPYGFLCVNQFMIFDPSLAANEKYSYSLEFKLISKFTDTSGYSYKALHNTVEKLIDPELYFVLHSSGDFIRETL